MRLTILRLLSFRSLNERNRKVKRNSKIGRSWLLGQIVGGSGSAVVCPDRLHKPGWNEGWGTRAVPPGLSLERIGWAFLTYATDPRPPPDTMQCCLDLTIDCDLG